MNIFRPSLFRAFAVAAALPLFAALAGCDVDDTSGAPSSSSGDQTFNFSGLYVSISNGTALVFPAYRQTGTTLTWLRLLQYGSSLQGYDNASQYWTGEISSVQESTATFSLQGRTSAGASVDISGTLTYANQQSTMNAAWIEPSFAGSIFAQATVSPATTNNTPTNSPSTNTNTIARFLLQPGPGATVAPHAWRVARFAPNPADFAPLDS